MNLIKRTSLNLSKVQANIIERNISKYFDVTIPKQLKAGKNEIKLKLLRPDIFVEGSSLLIDFYSDNEQNFNYYISEIANADSSRSIIVAIDQESVNGPCHLYLMAELRFGGSYLYIIDLEINNELENVQDIKFKSIPEVVYNEDIHPIQNTSNVSRNVTTTSKNQSIGTKPTLIPRQNYKDQFNVERTEVQSSITVSSLSNAGSSSFETLPKYTSPGLIYSDDFKFSGSMVNGTIEVNGLAGNKYVANILRVVDTSSIEVWPPYSDLVSGQLFNSFDNHRNFTCSFKDTVAVANSAYDQSYAVFDLYNLETTVGVLDSINVSYKILNQLGTDFQPIGNFKVESKNLLIDINNFEFDTRYGIVQKQIGKFRSEVDFLTYWDSGSVAEVKVYSDDILPNGLRLAPSQNFIFPRLNYKVYGTENTEFKLSFDYNNKFKGQLDVYITGSNVTSLQIQKRSSNLPDNTYGTYIGSVTERSGHADFEFKLQENGYIRPLFKFGDEVWSLANISLEPRKVIGYSPNQAKIVAPLTLPSGSELTFRLEYLNPSGKKVDNILTDIGGVFFSGGSLPSGGSGGGGGPVSVPDGTVSSSNQLTSSYDFRYEKSGRGLISSSAQVTFSQISGIPSTLVSGSNQLTSSYDVRYERKGTNIFSSSVQVVYSSVTGIPTNLISGSNQLTSSYDARYEVRGNNIVSSSAQVKAFLPANSVSGSDQLTSSYDTRYERKGTNIFSSSAQVVYSSITGAPANLVSGSNQLTSSYDVRYELRGNNIVSSSVQVKAFLPIGSISGSDQATSSYDTRYERRGFGIVSSSAQITVLLPTGTISSSNQFTSFSSPFTGSFTGSFKGDFKGDGSGLYNIPLVSGSVPMGTVTGSDQLTSSYDARYERKGTNIFSSSAQVIYNNITGVPTGLVSGSDQLTSSYDARYEVRGNNIVSSSAQVKAFLPIASVTGSDQLTSSYDVRYERKGTNIFSSSAQVVYSSVTGIPTNLVSGSNQLTSSYDTRYETRGNNIVSSSVQVKAFLPVGSVSGSDQLTSSYDVRYERKGTNIFSSSAQVIYSSVAGIPTNLVSGSNQLTSSYDTRYELRGNNIVSSSAQVISAFPAGVISGSNQLTSSYDARYEIRGSNIISSSGQFTSFSSPFTGSFTGSFKGLFTGDGSGLYNIPLVSGSVPMGTVTGSDQLTSSYDTRYERKGTNIFSSSAQVIYSSITGTPSNLVSGSNQLTSSYDTRYEVRGNNIVSSSAQVKSFLPANTISGSDQATSSYDVRYERKGTNIFSSSAQVLYNSITGIPTNLVSGSNQLTSSYDTRYEVKGNNIVSSSAQVKNFLPNNTISSSAQFTNITSPFTGSFTGSFKGDGSGLTNLPTGPGSVPDGTISSSLQFNSTTLPFTGSFNGNFEGSGSGLTNIPGTAITPGYFALLTSNIFSGSQEIQGSGSKIFSVQGSVGELFAVFDGLSGSLFAVKNISGLPIFEVFSDNQVKIGQYGSEPIKISGSQAIITGSFKGDGSGLVNLPISPMPANIISGSDQLTSSYDTRYERKGTNIFSSSAQVVYSNITGIPASLVSGSNQLTSSYDTRYERKGTNLFSASGQINYNEILNKPVITLPQSDRLLSSDGTVSGSRANDGLQYSSASSWTKLLLRTNVIQEQSYSSSFWTSQWTFVSQSTFVATPTNRNFSVYVPAGFNNDTNTPISSSTFHNSYSVEVENHIYGITGSKSAPMNSYNWNSTTQFRAYYNPANLTLSPLISSYVAQSSSIYQGMGGYGNAYAGRPDLNSWYSVSGVGYAGDGLFKIDLTLGPSSSFGWTLYIATIAKVIKHEIRV